VATSTDYGVVVSARIPTQHAKVLHRSARRAGRSPSAELRFALSDYFAGVEKNGAGLSPDPAPLKQRNQVRGDESPTA
jgi:hypothetical protein